MLGGSEKAGVGGSIPSSLVRTVDHHRRVLPFLPTMHPSATRLRAETQALLTVPGVGHLTALTFVLTLGSKERFGRSRDVGCYLGLRPRRSQSGDHDPQLGITHAGNAYQIPGG